MSPEVGRVYIGGPNFEVAACRGRRFLVRSIEPLTVNVLGKSYTKQMVEVAFMSRGRVAVDVLELDNWTDALPASGVNQ